MIYLTYYKQGGKQVKQTINFALVLLLLALLMFVSYVMGQCSVDAKIQRVRVNVDHQLLKAARQYHGLAVDDIFYYGDQLCFRRNNHTFAVQTGVFKAWYYQTHIEPLATEISILGTESSSSSKSIHDSRFTTHNHNPGGAHDQN